MSEISIKPVNMEKKAGTVSFRLDEDLIGKINEYAARKQLDRSKAIREIIFLYLTRG